MATASLLVTVNGGMTTVGGDPVNGSQSISALIGFGDSKIDSGYYFTHPISNNQQYQELYDQSVQAGGGVPTDPGSAMNSTILAKDLGVSAIPYGEPGGTNYAASSATISGAFSGSLAPSVVQQVTTYLDNVNNVADKNALYFITGGGNDASIAQQLGSQSDAISYMVQQADKLASSVGSLYADGARNFLIDDRSGPGVLRAAFDNRLWTDLSSAGITFLVSDSASLIKAVDANPAAYGITNTVQPPDGPFSSSDPYSSANGGSVVNPDPSLISDGWARFGTQDVSPTAAQTYLWADDEHLSGAGQRIEATYDDNVVQNAIPLPTEVLTATSTVFAEGAGTQANTSYQWQRDHEGQGWTNIAGATTGSYAVQTADIGDALRVEATFVGANGDIGTADSPATYAVACYCPGTLILTARGEVPIEALAISDVVVTAAGAHRLIKWIGHRAYAGRFVNGNRMALPIRFAAGSLGEGVPRRDLWVSPGHAMLVEDQLIHALLLVNGVSIIQVEAVDTVTYINVELDDHDVILAEGAPAESFHDNGMRNVFANAAEFRRRYPDDLGPGLPCLPLLEQGFHLEAIRRRLDARAGIVRPVPGSLGPLRGYVDVAGPDRVCGWAQDECHPEEPVRLDILVGGRRVMRILANQERADLHAAGLGSGRHAFEVTLPEECRGVVSVQRTETGVALSLTAVARDVLAKAA